MLSFSDFDLFVHKQMLAVSLDYKPGRLFGEESIPKAQPCVIFSDKTVLMVIWPLVASFHLQSHSIMWIY